MILLLVVSDYVGKLWRCLEDYWVHCFALANNTGGPVQEIDRLAFRCVVRVRAWLCNKAFVDWILPKARHEARFSKLFCICLLSQFSRQVQDSQCSPLASACEGKYRYCVAPCYCLKPYFLCRSKEHHAKLLVVVGFHNVSQHVWNCKCRFWCSAEPIKQVAQAQPPLHPKRLDSGTHRGQSLYQAIWKCWRNILLVGGFKYFLFSTLLGDMIQFD